MWERAAKTLWTFLWICVFTPSTGARVGFIQTLFTQHPTPEMRACDVGRWKLSTIGRFRLQKVHTQSAQNNITSIAFFMDGAILAMGSHAADHHADESESGELDGRVVVQLWNVHERRFVRTLRGGNGSVPASALTFPPTRRPSPRWGKVASALCGTRGVENACNRSKHTRIVENASHDSQIRDADINTEAIENHTSLFVRIGPCAALFAHMPDHSDIPLEGGDSL